MIRSKPSDRTKETIPDSNPPSSTLFSPSPSIHGRGLQAFRSITSNWVHTSLEIHLHTIPNFAKFCITIDIHHLRVRLVFWPLADFETPLSWDTSLYHQSCGPSSSSCLHYLHSSNAPRHFTLLSLNGGTNHTSLSQIHPREAGKVVRTMLFSGLFKSSHL